MQKIVKQLHWGRNGAEANESYGGAQLRGSGSNEGISVVTSDQKSRPQTLGQPSTSPSSRTPQKPTDRSNGVLEMRVTECIKASSFELAATDILPPSHHHRSE
jgi:hypothetical protein